MDSLRYQFENGHYIQSASPGIFLISQATRLEKTPGFTYTEIGVQNESEPGCLRVKLTCESAANFLQEKFNPQLEAFALV
jgi:hypothetical protein